MNKIRIKSFLMGMFALALFSCTNEELPEVKKDTSEVTFSFDAKKVMDTKAYTAVEGYSFCIDEEIALSVNIKLEGSAGEINLDALDLNLYGGNYKTAPYELKTDTYTVMSVLVYKKGTTEVVYSGVDGTKTPQPAFAQFIPEDYWMTKQTFKLDEYTKPTVPLYVLCARGENATNFGMPKFQLNLTEVNCFDMFFNVCDPMLDNEHIVGSGIVELYDIVAGTPETYKLLYSDAFGNENLATLCFPDKLYSPYEDNTNEFYLLKVTLNHYPTPVVYIKKISVASLLKFKESTAWSSSMNALHIVYCGGDFCIPFPDVECKPDPDPDPDPSCDGLATLYDNFNSYKTFNELFTVGPWKSFNGADKDNASSDTSLGLQTESNNGKNKQYAEMSFKYEQNTSDVYKEYDFETKTFKFKQGEHIAFEHWLRSVREATSNDKHKFKAIATLQLWSDNGQMVQQKVDEWVTPESDPLTATGNGDWHYVPAPKYNDPFPSSLIQDGCYYLKVNVKVYPETQKNGEGTFFEAGRTYYLGIDNLVKYSGENPNQI